MEETQPPSKTSDENSWPVTEDQSSSRVGSRRRPDWNTRESLKCKDTSEWPSWECSQGNKDIQKGDTLDTEVLASADSSFEEQRGRGRLREASRDGGWNGSAKRHSEISKRNSWHVTKDHLSSRNGHSRRWPGCDALDSSKCEDDSGWPSWECSQEKKDTHNDDTVDREVHTVSNYTFDEQRGQSKIWKRGRSRSRQREYSKSRSRSPCNGPRQASCRLSEKGSVSEKTSRRCRDFAAGKCSRGSQCKFLHQGYLNSRHRDHPRNELTDKSKFRSDDRGTLQFCDYKGSASGPCDEFSDNCKDYCEEVESRKDAVCWKKSLDGKCLRKESCRYSHHRSSGEEYDRRNERIAYDQNDCRFSHDVGRITTGFLDAAKTKRCDEDCSLDRPKANHYGRGEDEIKSEKCSAWDKFAGVSEKPKDTTGWGKWPGKPDNWNSSFHDSLGGEKMRINKKSFQHETKLSGRGEDEIKSEKCSTWDKYAGVSEKPKDTTGWGKWPCKPDNWNSSSHDSLGGEKTRSNQKSFQHETKLSRRGEDEIKSEKCSAWDKFAGVSEKPKDTTSWGKWPGKPDNWNSSFHDSLGGEKTRINQKSFQHETKLSGRGEDEIKSEKCSTWDKYAGVSEKPKDTTGWGKWPCKPDNWNSSSHDSLGGEKTRSNLKSFQHETKLSGRGEDEIKSEKCSAWDKFAGVSEKPKDTTGWGKWPGKPNNWNSSSHDSLGGEKKRLNQKSLQHETKLSGRGEDEIKSEKCSAWDKFAGVSKKPKDTTGWDKWPGKPENYIWNSNSQSKRWDGRSKGNICSQDLSEVKKQIDDNILRNSVTKSGKRNDFRSNEKLSERDKLIDLNMPVDREKAMGQGKDKTESWTGPTCDKDWSLNRPKAKLFVWAENVKKSENGSTWDSERPKDTSSRDNWPAWPDSSNANSNSHDPQNKTNMDFKMLANKEKAKLSEWGENTKKSENGLAWDKFAGVSERPKDATSWDNWPAWPDSSNGNSNTHDPQRKRRDCRSEGNIYSQDLRDAKKQAYDNILYNSVKKSSERADPGRHEKFSEREEFLQSHLRNGASNSTNMDLKMLVNKEKAMGQKKDMTNLWNAPTWGDEGCSLDRPRDTGRDGTMIGKRDPCIFADIEKHTGGNIAHNLNDGKKSPNQWDNKKNSWNPKCDDSTCFLDNTEASGWGGSMSFNDRHSHDPVDEEKPSQNNIVKTDCEMAISGQDNKVVGKDEYRPPHMLNGREGVDKDTGNLLASKKIFYRKENQIEAQGSEPGGFIFPPSSLMGLSQSSHALSPNPSNGFNVILDKSVKYKLSALVNQMQNQFEEALKILETWACHNSITADQALRLSKLQAYLSENGVHAKSNEVLEKLKMEYLESSATILKQQEPVGYTELNQKTLMVENVSGNNSKGEQRKKDEEIIQSVGADARREAGESKQDEKSTWLFKNALVKLVKEILNPIWMQGQMKKEVHNTIVKKAVDKVISTEGVNIPRTQEHTEQYLSFSKPQISGLINDYVAFFKIQGDSS